MYFIATTKKKLYKEKMTEWRNKMEHDKCSSLIGIYRTLYPTRAECTFFSNVHGNSPRQSDHILDH